MRMTSWRWPSATTASRRRPISRKPAALVGAQRRRVEGVGLEHDVVQAHDGEGPGERESHRVGAEARAAPLADEDAELAAAEGPVDLLQPGGADELAVGAIVDGEHDRARPVVGGLRAHAARSTVARRARRRCRGARAPGAHLGIVEPRRQLRRVLAAQRPQGRTLAAEQEGALGHGPMLTRRIGALRCRHAALHDSHLRRAGPRRHSLGLRLHLDRFGADDRRSQLSEHLRGAARRQHRRALPARRGLHHHRAQPGRAQLLRRLGALPRVPRGLRRPSGRRLARRSEHRDLHARQPRLHRRPPP